ncbi:MAG TPA: TonB-dependent receptor [Burkholderiales bacterium]|nr:TonB-dependent receptor [Burkholderiales bacterium]
MVHPGIIAAAIAVALGLAPAVQAQTNPELDEIRQQIKELKDSYESRIQALEKRLKDAEEAAAKAQTAATQAQSAAAPTQASAPPAPSEPAQASQQGSPNAFNPAISVILTGTYANFSQDPAKASVTGFLSNADTSAALGPRGFSLGESEVTLSSNVDHLFYGQATFAFEPDSTFSVEEAFAQTTSLGYGLTIKGGRFFSAIGYENSVHPHAWDFVDPSLVQRVFLGDNYADDGVQASWIAPLPVFVEIGGSVGRGIEPPASNRDKNGVGAGTLFAHVGDDIGTGGSYRVGVSMLRTSTDGTGTSIADIDDRTGTTNRFVGDTQLYGLDFVYKWAPEGNPKYQNFKLIGEWFQQRRSGDLTFDETGALGIGPTTEAFALKQSGWYLQGVYQFHPEWRVGLRYDQLDEGSWNAGPVASANGVVKPDFTPRRYGAMIDWNPSEFSRLRLQFSQDKSQLGLTDNQIFLQYIFSLGTHGAHKF